MEHNSLLLEIVKKAFNSSLGQQCNSLFSTSDNNIFIRFEEAKKHINNTIPEINTDIYEWFEEFEGNSINPKYFSIKSELNSLENQSNEQ